jgi:mono/diheme cytochrome c family protein
MLPDPCGRDKRRCGPGHWVAVALTALTLLSCRGQTSKETPVVFIRNMYDQPKYEIQSYSDFFDDHRTMRLPVEGVVAREAEIDVRIAQGRTEDETTWVLTIPQEVVDKAGGMGPMVERGRDRFNIFCAPCHGRTGAGNGMVAQRAAAIPGAAALAPTNLHLDRLRHIPDGQLFGTITNGIRNMPSYGPQVPGSDRWAIVAYVRALQLSQASLSPPEQK